MRDRRTLFWIAAFALMTVPVFFLRGYALANLAMVFTYAVALMGLVLLTGHGGQISLGHGAFFAIGAYCTAILMEQANCPYWLAIPLSGAACFALGWLFGWPALRLPGHHLALATFALAMAVPQVLRFTGLETWTHGTSGIALTPVQAPAFTGLKTDQWMYLCALSLWALMLAISRGVAAGRMGRAMRALRDNPAAAIAMGVDPSQVKTRAFGLSTMYTGLAGSMAALIWQFAAPDSFSVMLSIAFFVGAVAGGLTSFGATIAGAALIQYLPNLTEQVSKSAPTAVYGILLIVLMFALPDGFSGGLRRLLGWSKRTRSTAATAPARGAPDATAAARAD